MTAPAPKWTNHPACVENVVANHADALQRSVAAEVRRALQNLAEDLKRELQTQHSQMLQQEAVQEMLEEGADLPGGVRTPRLQIKDSATESLMQHSQGLRNGLEDLISPSSHGIVSAGLRDYLPAREASLNARNNVISSPSFVSVTPAITDARRMDHKSSVIFGTQFRNSQDKKSRVCLDKTDFICKVQNALNPQPYDVAEYYHEEGCCQRIARSTIFERVTLFVITFNSVWIAIDVDLNPSDLLYEAPAVFQIMENFFCIYFVLEWIIRFGAFRSKRDCLNDSWFCFDTVMMVLIVFETWIMNGILFLLASDNGRAVMDTSVLKLFRLLRLSRTARMAKLLNALPELMIMVKGLMQATRSVFSTLLLLMIIIYIFAIAFRQLTDDMPIGRQYFETVPEAMVSLLLYGALPDVADFTMDLGKQHVWIGGLGLFYVLVAGLTLLNMLVGVLVQVVLEVAEVEKEQQTASFVKSSLEFLLNTGDDNHDGRISVEEFDHLVLNPQAIRTLSQVGVDVVGLASLRDFIFSVQDNMPFDDFFTLVLQLRASNTATVKDIVEMRRFVVQELELVTRTMEENGRSLLKTIENQKAPTADTRQLSMGTESLQS